MSEKQMFDLKTLTRRLEALTVFRALRSDPVISALIDVLHADGERAVSLYALCVSRLYAAGYTSMGQYIADTVKRDENVYIRAVGQGRCVPPVIAGAVEQELLTLSALASLTPAALVSPDAAAFCPCFEVYTDDLSEAYRDQVVNIGRRGYGMYAQYHMFTLDETNRIVPVRHPDSTRLDELIDYDREKKIIIDNTRALLAGLPAANILLTGDAGTGKSSTVKAVVNELYTEGLRILEIRKEQLRVMPGIMDELAANPLKFILFIDDLSFYKNDDDFAALKAILEGSVSARPSNVAIYATSNRRHLVRESMADRDGDDVHRNDTMQEFISLSERFGIHLTFSKPDKQTYLDIVHHLAAAQGLTTPQTELDLLAERFALAKGARSARAARQFVDSLIAAQT